MKIKYKNILLRMLLLLVSLSIINCKNTNNRIVNNTEVRQDTVKVDLNMKMLTIEDESNTYIVKHLKRDNNFYDSIFDQSFELFFRPYYSKHRIDSLDITVEGALQEVILFKNENQINYLTVSEFLDKDPTLFNDAYNKITYKLYNAAKDSIWSYIIENTKDVKSKGCHHLDIIVTDDNKDSRLELNLFYEKFYGGEDPSIIFYLLKNGSNISKIYDYDYLNEGDESFDIDGQLQKMSPETKVRMKNNWKNYLVQRKGLNQS